MAFETVSGQKVFSSMTGTTYIFADYFVVFQGESVPPAIYDWGQITSITEATDKLTIVTENRTYYIERAAFSSEEQLLSVRAIIEGQIALHPEIRYKFGKRILPLKYLYKNINSANAYVMHGNYEDKVINSCNISLVSARFGRYIFLLAIALIAIIFLVLVNVLGNFKENWIYCLPISIFSGIIVSVVIYLVVGIIARHKFNAINKIDPAASKEITVVVAPEGFAAVESFVYTTHDLIPWSEANFFIETHVGIVVLRDNKSVFWLPKSFIPKNEVNNILALISSRVKQR
ncbi:MAG: hypothetical protein NC203_01890 [Firmicutes bacterium]|nr:hypothetical protein [[Eubacterium] siraeum]MCM1487094.1 hypothetical protein [Bacillota bacterium]